MDFLARWGAALTRWTKRWVPDSWAIALMLTLVVLAAAIEG